MQTIQIVIEKVPTHTVHMPKMCPVFMEPETQ